ncbi:MAG: class I SAM-dependent methyltransferase [Aquificota bacterium]|nr:class I SAM-dependent methyltransferase [Aquificota bacterium]
MIWRRAEEVDREFDIVLSRAMGEFEDIYPILESLSKEYVFVMKGEKISERWEKELGYRACRTKVPKLPPSYILWKRLK